MAQCKAMQCCADMQISTEISEFGICTSQSITDLNSIGLDQMDGGHPS